MIYLDCAATSLQKPASVERAMRRAMATMASPGRGAHISAMRAADTVFECRQAVSELFNVGDPERVVFTFNATHALNIAINSLVGRGDKVVVSGYEHNSVTRPLAALNAKIVKAYSPLFEPEAAVEAFEKSIDGAAAVVCTHVSNVFGYILPIGEIAGICRKNGVPLIIDASQSAGALEVDFTALGADFIAMPGHKGLLGPQGTGVLLCGSAGKPLLHGGTGGSSLVQTMPEYLPDRLEAGTHNVTGIAGLLAGVRYVAAKKPANIAAHERGLMLRFASMAEKIPGVELFLSDVPDCQTGVLSLRSEKMSCEELAEMLGKRGVGVRSGLHCAPFAHQTAKTVETGTVRFSFSPFNTKEEAVRAASVLRSL